MADTVWFAGDPSFGASTLTKQTWSNGEWDYPDLGHYAQFENMGRVAGINNYAGTHQIYGEYFNPDYGPISTGEYFLAYVYLSATNTPQQLAIRFKNNSGVWAGGYWGANLWTPSNSYYIGALPSAGSWQRLTIPLSTITNFSDGNTFDGFSFTLYDGQAWFDIIGITDSVSEVNSDPKATVVEALAVGKPASSDPKVTAVQALAITGAPDVSDPKVTAVRASIIASWTDVVPPGPPAEYNVTSLIY